MRQLQKLKILYDMESLRFAQGDSKIESWVLGNIEGFIGQQSL